MRAAARATSTASSRARRRTAAELSRVAIVTGASSGIGLAVAQQWVRRGGKVAMVARTPSSLERAAKDLGDDAAAFPLDVLDTPALIALPDAVVARFGRLDVIVNNAGFNRRGPIDRFTPEELAQIVTTNLVAPIVLSRAALPKLERGGSIVQIASIAGMVPVPHEAAYSASKAGLRAFSRAVAYELEAQGIHVGCVCPGPVDTGFLGDLEEVPDIVLSQPMVTADDVAAEVMRCIDERAEEIAIPAKSGRLATAGYLLPAFAKRIRPVLEKRGAKNKATLLEKRRKSVS
ncbi:MAG: SDR family oxidoreductase [Labilithrix sp.]|nr:SDR family oxidoreductase [Labilithrix sp.]MCW5816244.1 SDR family oxidoreductase [Labilithrix sp.]